MQACDRPHLLPAATRASIVWQQRRHKASHHEGIERGRVSEREGKEQDGAQDVAVVAGGGREGIGTTKADVCTVKKALHFSPSAESEAAAPESGAAPPPSSCAARQASADAGYAAPWGLAAADERRDLPQKMERLNLTSLVVLLAA